MIDIVFTIVFTVGKMIGIFLLVLLAVLLAVLFVPFRYAVSAEKYADRSSEADADEDNTKRGEVQRCRISCSWLLHLVHVRILLDGKQTEGEKTSVECYLFGVPIFALRHKITSLRQNLRKKNRRDSHAYEVEKIADVQEEAGMDADIQPKAEKQKESRHSAGISAKTEVKTKSLRERLLSPLKGIWNKITETIKSIWMKIRGIAHKLGECGSFLRQDTTKAAFQTLFGKGRRIVLHLLPRKIRGKLIFGFSDPALTGEVLGIVSWFYLRYQRAFTLIPVFDYPVLEGKVQMRGRMYLSYLIWQAVSLLRDRDVRKAWKDIKCLAKEK